MIASARASAEPHGNTETRKDAEPMMDQSHQPRPIAQHIEPFIIAVSQLIATVSLWMLVSTTAAVSGSQFVENGLAVSGYDAVAYRSASRPVQGIPELTLEWNGAVWRFSSATNRDAFEDDPSRYAPAYDGHCAYAVSEGRKSGGVPELWRIANGRLFLLCSKIAVEKWTTEFSVRLTQADQNWRTLEFLPAAAPKAPENPLSR